MQEVLFLNVDLGDPAFRSRWRTRTPNWHVLPTSGPPPDMPTASIGLDAEPDKTR